MLPRKASSRSCRAVGRSTMRMGAPQRGHGHVDMGCAGDGSVAGGAGNHRQRRATGREVVGAASGCEQGLAREAWVGCGERRVRQVGLIRRFRPDGWNDRPFTNLRALARRRFRTSCEPRRNRGLRLVSLLLADGTDNDAIPPSAPAHRILRRPIIGRQVTALHPANSP